MCTRTIASYYSLFLKILYLATHYVYLDPHVINQHHNAWLKNLQAGAQDGVDLLHADQDRHNAWLKNVQAGTQDGVDLLHSRKYRYLTARFYTV